MAAPRPGRQAAGAPTPWATLTASALVAAWAWVLAGQATRGGMAFLVPPHLALYAAGILAAAGLARRSRIGATGLGLFLASLAWDAWWHSGRPAPAPFLTPPHLLAALATALLLVRHGVMAALAPGRDRGAAPLRRATDVAVVLAGLAFLATELVGRPNLWHGADFYLASSALFPAWLVAARGRGAGGFGATLAALAHMAVTALCLAVAAALTSVVGVGGGGGGAVVPHLPPVLVATALGVDLLARGGERLRGIAGGALLACGLGTAFLGLMLATHWPLGDVLLPALDAPFLRWGEPVGAEGGWSTRYWTLAPGRRALAVGLGGALVLAILSSALGLLVVRGLHAPGAGRGDAPP